MSQDEDRRRLMTYPKEVLVDYLLDARYGFGLLNGIDWRKLDFERNQLKGAKLQAEAKALIESSKTERGEAWWSIQKRLDSIEKQFDKLNAEQDNLLGIHHDRPPTPTD
jgi:hypothetical protein